MTNCVYKISRRSSGFTLLELTIALFVITLMIGGLLGPMSTRMEQNDRKETEEKLEEIKQALYGFALENGRLPCPDTDGDGLENSTGTGAPCSNLGSVADFAVGNLPWLNLGVAQTDAWGQPFAYGVTQSFGDQVDGAPAAGVGGTNPPCSPTPQTGISFELCSGGAASINNLQDTSDTDFAVVARNVPAIVISYGANFATTPGAGTDEGENRNGDAVAVDAGYRGDPANEFDDMLIWVSAPILKNLFVQAGLLP